MFTPLYNSIERVQELLKLGFSKYQIKELHDRYSHSYEDIYRLAKVGYSYNTIVDIFAREAFKQFKNDVLFHKYKIYGDNITGSVKNPKFNFKIVRL